MASTYRYQNPENLAATLGSDKIEGGQCLNVVFLLNSIVHYFIVLLTERRPSAQSTPLLPEPSHTRSRGIGVVTRCVGRCGTAKSTLPAMYTRCRRASKTHTTLLCPSMVMNDGAEATPLTSLPEKRWWCRDTSATGAAITSEQPAAFATWRVHYYIAIR